MKLTDRPCPICQTSQNSHVAMPANFDFAQLDQFAYASRKVPENMHFQLNDCSSCDLRYASPAPTSDDLDREYLVADFDSTVEARFAARTYIKSLKKILVRGLNRESALDIGTGDGAFLKELLNYGFKNVVGVEPSAAPIAKADSKIKPLIRHSPFRKSDFNANSFDLVTCFQTLEHVYDPLEALSGMSALLKPGGALFVVVHNRKATANRVMGLKSPIYDIEHMQLFSTQSIRTALEKAGFENVEVKTIVNTYPLQYWLRLSPLPRSIKGSVEKLLRGLSRLALPVPVGNMAAIGFKK